MTIELRCLTCEKEGIINPFETGMGDESVVDLAHLLGTKDNFLDLSNLPGGKPDFVKLRTAEKEMARVIVTTHAMRRHVVPAARQEATRILAEQQGKTVEQVLQEAASRNSPLLSGEWDLRSKMPRPEIEVSGWRRPLMIPTAYLGLTE